MTISPPVATVAPALISVLPKLNSCTGMPNPTTAAPKTSARAPTIIRTVDIRTAASSSGAGPRGAYNQLSHSDHEHFLPIQHVTTTDDPRIPRRTFIAC